MWPPTFHISGVCTWRRPGAKWASGRVNAKMEADSDVEDDDIMGLMDLDEADDSRREREQAAIQKTLQALSSLQVCCASADHNHI